MKTSLTIVLICFFALMNIWLLLAIVQGVLYAIYQKTDRIYISAFVRCYITGSYFTLECKGKEIDKVFAYTKHKGYSYVLGLNGIYKIKGTRLEMIDEAKLQIGEVAIIGQMKEESYARAMKDQALLQLYLAGNDTGDTAATGDDTKPLDRTGYGTVF